ncbi:hypothetical protein CHLNCDRAFT_138039 [Chlorella variabilis]|uniref:Uncharacterized protein n=1 Tax=Chlorella variabilis TaxID=554065 RepID=E1Z544_CHLVA|nr:hypothetical protein CHLNCDRAFT_138039 [Chlorella variabilis]EFN59166.1 hypothetical protein CHLNCDRAFT_138039 [Chlorella variabilis]|eukprot:XP_005851268.1 hypothetical protein CHLNCDRAFT_138039 [Chlorella variabilis]
MWPAAALPAPPAGGGSASEAWGWQYQQLPGPLMHPSMAALRAGTGGSGGSSPSGSPRSGSPGLPAGSRLVLGDTVIEACPASPTERSGGSAQGGSPCPPSDPQSALAAPAIPGLRYASFQPADAAAQVPVFLQQQEAAAAWAAEAAVMQGQPQGMAQASAQNEATLPQACGFPPCPPTGTSSAQPAALKHSLSSHQCLQMPNTGWEPILEPATLAAAAMGGGQADGLCFSGAPLRQQEAGAVTTPPRAGQEQPEELPSGAIHAADAPQPQPSIAPNPGEVDALMADLLEQPLLMRHISIAQPPPQPPPPAAPG